MIEHGLAPERAELIRGVICEKKSKTFLHSALLSRLGRLMERQLGDRFWVRREDPLTLVDSEPEPDISVVKGADLDYAPHHPQSAILVVEVAVTSMSDDREQAFMYAAAGVAEYWIVNARAGVVEVFTQPVNGAYQQVHSIPGDGVLVSSSLPELQIDLPALFAGLPPAVTQD